MELDDDEKATLKDRKEKMQTLPTTINYAKDQLAIVMGLSRLEEQTETFLLAEKQKLDDKLILKLLVDKNAFEQNENEEFQEKMRVLQYNYEREKCPRPRILKQTTRIRKTHTVKGKNKLQQSHGNISVSCPPEALLAQNPHEIAINAGAVLVPCAAGAIIHSNNVDPAKHRGAIMQATGMNSQMAETAVRQCLAL